MGRLEELISLHCPDGVTRVRLGDVCQVLRGKRLTKSQLNDEGKYPVLHGGLTPLGFYDEFNRKAGTTIVVNTGNAGCVYYSKTCFWSSDACFSLYPNNSVLLDRYLYYVVYGLEPVIKNRIRAGAMPTIDASAVERLEIPLPPLLIQQEIIHVLDSIIDLKENLQQEFDARIKQYEAYRDKLLGASLSIPNKGVSWAHVNEVAVLSRGVRVVRANLNEAGEYPVYQNSLTPLGFFTEFNYPAHTTFVICAGAAGEIGYSETPFWAADDCTCFTCGQRVLSKYLFFCLQSQQSKIKSQVRTASVPRLAKSALERIEIPVPTITKQESIIDALDAFLAICKNVQSEITARQKQYEYYREKILSI